MGCVRLFLSVHINYLCLIVSLLLFYVIFGARLHWNVSSAIGLGYCHRRWTMWVLIPALTIQYFNRQVENCEPLHANIYICLYNMGNVGIPWKLGIPCIGWHTGWQTLAQCVRTLFITATFVRNGSCFLCISGQRIHHFTCPFSGLLVGVHRSCFANVLWD